MANFFSLNAALPLTTTSYVDHTALGDPPRHSFEYESETRHTSRKSQSRARNGDIGGSFPQAMPAPYGNAAHGESNASGRPPFDLARSPPNPSSKNTKHVPCKFFRQGACQAGNACPFSHSLDPVTQTQPCKYFQKGTCKFGAKCALLHVYPDGTLANRPGGTVNLGRTARGFSTSNQHPPPPFLNTESSLSNSLLSQQRQYSIDTYPNQFPYSEQDESDVYNDRYAIYRNGPNETGIVSPPGSHFGSPLEEAQFPRSPVENLHTALNAPLPQSFDPNRPSRIAQFGPLGQSVPDKFGMKSPPASLPKRGMFPPDSSNNNRGLGSSNLRNGTALASSPQMQDEVVGQKIMHSQRNARSNRLSNSVPQGGPLDDWEDNFTFEQDLLPNSVRDEVLTPQEKMRRLSKPDQEPSIFRDQSSGLAIPSGGSSKVGSPSMAGSPSRYRAIFEQQQQQREKREQEGGNLNGFSGFGHVGSPLRESWMPDGASSKSSNTLSGISQQMVRMQLNPSEVNELNAARLLAPGSRHGSAPIGRFERQGLTSPGIGSTRIDEEVEGLVFSMDGDWGGRSPRLSAMDSIGNPSTITAATAATATTTSWPIDIKDGIGGVGHTNGSGSEKGMFGFR